MGGKGRVFADIDISLDGFVAGDGVGIADPLGNGGGDLVWYGDDVNDADADLVENYGGVDAQVLDEAAKREGAVIMGRTTFDVSIAAWGQVPPIRKPCFVLTTRPGPTITRGDTTFVFAVSLDDALHRARRAAAGRDIGVMGGASTVRQFLLAGLLDELHLHVVPVLLGSGIRLFDRVARRAVDFGRPKVRQGAKATHLLYPVKRPVVTSDR